MTEALLNTYQPFPEELRPQGFSVEEVLIAGDRGPCGGVIRAVNAVEGILELVKEIEERTGVKIPVYANHPIVHNDLINKELSDKGLEIQPDPDQVKKGEIYALSAHGTKRSVVQKLKQRGVIVYNLECHLVTADRTRAEKILADGKDLAYIAMPGHPEPDAVLGDLDPERARLIDYRLKAEEMDFPDRPFGVLSQTTLSRRQSIRKVETWSDAHPEREKVIFKDGPCIATDNRQDSLQDILDISGKPVDLVVSFGSSSSQNLKELVKTGKLDLLKRHKGMQHSIRIDTLDDLIAQQNIFTKDIRRVAVTSAASTFDKFTIPTLQWFQQMGAIIRVTDPREKYETFSPPVKQFEEVKSRIQEFYGIAA